MIWTPPLRIVIALVLSLGLAACQSSEERAEEHYQSALTLVSESDPERAIVELRNVFDLNGSHREARRLIAELLLEQGNSQGAYSQYLRLAEQYPDDLDARVELSSLAFLGRNWDEVERHGAEAERLAPEDPRVRVLTLVRAYRDAVEAEDADARREVGAMAATMLEADPENALLLNLTIDTHLRDSEFSDALTQLRRLIEIDPTNVAYNEQLVSVLAQIGDETALETQLRRMVELSPADPAPKTKLIRFYLSLDKTDEAEAFLRELVEQAEPDNDGPQVDLVRFLIETRGVEAARTELQSAITASDDPVTLRMIQAGLDFDQGDRTGAVSQMEDILTTIDPEDERLGDIKIALAKMLQSSGNEVGARTRVEEVLAADATQSEALKMQAAWNIADDDTDAAITALRLALDQESEDSEAMTLMAEAYTRSGSSQLARDFLALAVEASGNAPGETIRYARVLIDEERYLPAEDILLPALRLAPQNVDLLQILGQLYLAMDDYARTGQIIDTLRRLQDPRAAQAATALEVARIDAQTGTDEAIDYLETLAGAADADLTSQLMLLRARLSTGDFEGAETMATDMQAEESGNEELKYVLAVTKAAGGKLDEAEGLYRELLDSDPSRPAVWRDLSRLKLRTGDTEAAETLIEDGLAQVPGDPELLWGKASLLEREGRIDEAIAVYETLYEENSDSLLVVNNLASLLATYRDDPESLDRAWTIARRLRDTDLPPLQDTYGWIAQKRGDSADALPYLEAAAEGLPQDPLVQYHLGMAYRDLARPADALAQMEKAIDIAGPADTRAQIEEARALVLSLPGEIATGEDGAGETGARTGDGSTQDVPAEQN